MGAFNPSTQEAEAGQSLKPLKYPVPYRVPEYPERSSESSLKNG